MARQRKGGTSRVDQPAIARRRNRGRAAPEAAVETATLEIDEAGFLADTRAGSEGLASGDPGQGTLTPELEALVAEAEASPIAADTTEQAGPAPVEISDDVFLAIVGKGVQAGTNLACDWKHLTRLEENEVQGLSGALLMLAKQYDMLGQLDPKTAAWLNLGLTVAAIAGNRRFIVEQPANDTQPAEALAA